RGREIDHKKRFPGGGSRQNGTCFTQMATLGVISGFPGGDARTLDERWPDHDKTEGSTFLR
ncbi:MAG: hypothetical protein OEU40_04580, partial [Gammaproteobacteria bacterium]|nr:hypothetical protein [Gammaproteobacteria bacterium]